MCMGRTRSNERLLCQMRTSAYYTMTLYRKNELSYASEIVGESELYD